MKLSERVWVAPIEDKMRETRHRWFGHIKRRDINASVRRWRGSIFRIVRGVEEDQRRIGMR